MGFCRTGCPVFGPGEGAMNVRRILYTGPVLGVLVAGLTALSAPAAGAYGPTAEYQIGISQNCNNPDICGPFLGGFWGWVEFDNDNTADAQLAFCGHEQGGGGGSAGHFAAEAEGWYIGANGNFILNGPETDTYTGHGPDGEVIHGPPVVITFENVNSDSGIPATPGHYSTDELLGFSAPGIAFQIQVVKIPGR
jgi:hypothetical protein